MGVLSLAQTSALLGHKSTQTTLRYADHLTEAVRGYSQKTADIIVWSDWHCLGSSDKFNGVR
jgi:hypothetical protein